MEKMQGLGEDNLSDCHDKIIEDFLSLNKSQRIEFLARIRYDETLVFLYKTLLIVHEGMESILDGGFVPALCAEIESVATKFLMRKDRKLKRDLDLIELKIIVSNICTKLVSCLGMH